MECPVLCALANVMSCPVWTSQFKVTSCMCALTNIQSHLVCVCVCKPTYSAVALCEQVLCVCVCVCALAKILSCLVCVHKKTNGPVFVCTSQYMVLFFMCA